MAPKNMGYTLRTNPVDIGRRCRLEVYHGVPTMTRESRISWWWQSSRNDRAVGCWARKHMFTCPSLVCFDPQVCFKYTVLHLESRNPWPLSISYARFISMSIFTKVYQTFWMQQLWPQNYSATFWNCVPSPGSQQLNSKHTIILKPYANSK